MSRTARRLGLAVAGVGFAALAGFATASPAAADNGPHVLLSGSMVSSADGCAGCHRMHGAQVGADELFRYAAEGTAFCYTCHSGGTGATTNVKDGVSTLDTTNSDTNAMSTHTSSYLNAGLRGGGFENNRISGGSAVQGNIYWYASRNSWSTNKYAATANSGIHPNAYGEYVWGALIPAGASESSTSTHQLEVATTMWGSGTTGVGATSVTLECINCHNPHGNGNYRILRPFGFEGDSGAAWYSSVKNVFKEWNSSTSWTAPAVDPYNTTTTTKYMETFTVAQAPTFVPGQPVIVAYAGGGAPIESGTVFAVDAVNMTVTIGNTLGLMPASPGTGTVYLMPNFPSTITKAMTTGETQTVNGLTQYKMRYYTFTSMLLLNTQVLTISNVTNTQSAYAMKQTAIFNVNTAGKYFDAWVGAASAPATVGLEAGLYIDGIPDALTVTDTDTAGTVKTNPGIPVGAAGRGNGKVYTTTNYFIADDVYYSGTFQVQENKTSMTSTPFIANVSQWCSTCHTRYLSDNRKMQNNDSFYTYRHRSNSGSQGSPNCVQCHVAHGTSALATGAQSAALKMPDGTTTEGSVLLRVDNRGVCLMCHNPYGVS
jgi:predicted CXXCH cytochrome family protein